MEEDPPNGGSKTPDPAESADDKSEENVKRLKTSDPGIGRFEESSSSSNNTELETASTSTEHAKAPSPEFKGFARSRNRNYRNSHEDDHESSGREDEDMEEVAEPDQQISGDADDDDWEDCEGDGDDASSNDDDDDHPIFNNSNSSSSDDSNSTVMQDSDGDSNDIDHPLLKKEKPKHNWFVINEINKRQFGTSANLQTRELFQRKCYGSLYTVKRLELMYKLEEHGGCVNSLNFHPNGTLLASGSDDLKVVIWDWKIGKCLMKYKTRHRGNVFQSKFLHLSGDLHIASCARDGQVRLAQLSREEGIRNARLLGSHKGPCHKLIVLPEQPQIILSAGEDGVVLNHDVRDPKSTKIVTVKEDGKEVALYSIHGHPLKTNEFCVSGRDSIVRTYDQRKSNRPSATFTPFKKVSQRPSLMLKKTQRNYHVTCAVYNYNGSEILASYSDADVYLFDVNDQTPGKFIHQYQGHRNGATIKGVNFFGPKSEFVVSGSDCGHIYFWERNTESLVQWLLADDNGVVNCLEPHPQLPFICTSGLDWDVKVWVPSCENEPRMEGLPRIIKHNALTKSSFSDPSDINESQMLWMLWRHLRNTSRYRTTAVLDPREVLNSYPESNTSGSNSSSSGDDSEDDSNRTPNCSTS